MKVPRRDSGLLSDAEEKSGRREPTLPVFSVVILPSLSLNSAV